MMSRYDPYALIGFIAILVLGSTIGCTPDPVDGDGGDNGGDGNGDAAACGAHGVEWGADTSLLVKSRASAGCALSLSPTVDNKARISVDPVGVGLNRR